MLKERFCRKCGIKLTLRYKITFCSNKCQSDFEYAEFIDSWRKGEVSGGIGIHARAVSAYVRRYLREKFGSGCSLCGWNKVHSVTKRIPLEIDHIDGDSENNSEDNLRLICPNCHALTPSFRGLNKGKGRRWRMDKYILNKP